MTDIVSENDLTEEELPKIERFKKWRGDKADDELPLVFAAIELGRFVNGKSMLELQNTFDNVKSPKYIELFNVRKPVYKLMLFSRLKIEDYYINMTDQAGDEGQLVQEALSAVSEFYVDYNSNIETRFAAFITLISKWLDTCPKNRKAEELCLVLFTLLKIINIRINRLPFLLDVIVGYMIDLENCRNTMRDLLEKTTSKLRDWTAQNLHTTQQIVDPIYKAVYESLNLENRQPDIKVVETTLQKLITIRKTIADMLKIRKEISAYETEQSEINTMLMDCDRSPSLSFPELIKKHENIWVKLFNMSNSTEQAEWKEKIVNLNNPTILKSLNVFLSYATAGLVSTTDSDNKLALKNMSQNRLIALAPHLSIAKNHLSKLTTGNESLNQLIESSSSEALETFVTNCDPVISAINQYQDLAKKMIAQREALEKIKDAHQSIEIFLDIHHDFFVILSNFFAKIWSVFKTEKAMIVDKVMELQKEIQAFEKGYDEALKDNISSFQNDPKIPLMAKETLLKSGLFEPAIGSNSSAPKEKKPEESKLQEFFFSINANHTELGNRVELDSKDTAMFKMV